MKIIFYITFLIFISSCSNDNAGNKNQRDQKPPAKLDVTPPVITKTDDNDSTRNEVDKKGRKIGRWETVVNGEVWKTEFYIKGKLQGLVTERLNNGEILETRFKKGKKDGYSIQYVEGSKVAKYLKIYRKDKRIFSTFPQDLINGNFDKVIYSTDADTLDLRIKYISGKKLYRGIIVKKSGIRGVPIGRHKVFYENGKRKFILDFEKDSIYHYNRKGKPIDTSFFSFEKKVWPSLDEVEI